MTKYEQMKKDHRNLSHDLRCLKEVRSAKSLSVMISGYEAQLDLVGPKFRTACAELPQCTISADEEDQISQLLDSLIWAREATLQALQLKLEAVEELLS